MLKIALHTYSLKAVSVAPSVTFDAYKDASKVGFVQAAVKRYNNVVAYGDNGFKANVKGEAATKLLNLVKHYAAKKLANETVTGQDAKEMIQSLINGRADLYSECYREEHNTIPMEHFADSLMKKIKRDIKRLTTIYNSLSDDITLKMSNFMKLPAYCDSLSGHYTGILNKRSERKILTAIDQAKPTVKCEVKGALKSDHRANVLFTKLVKHYKMARFYRYDINRATIQEPAINLGVALTAELANYYHITIKDVTKYISVDDFGRFLGTFNIDGKTVKGNARTWIIFINYLNSKFMSIDNKRNENSNVKPVTHEANIIAKHINEYVKTDPNKMNSKSSESWLKLAYQDFRTFGRVTSHKLSKNAQWLEDVLDNNILFLLNTDRAKNAKANQSAINRAKGLKGLLAEIITDCVKTNKTVKAN